MGSGNRGGFVVDKGEATERDFGLGLKMMMMGNHHHHDNHHTHDEESSSKFARFSGDHGANSPGGSAGVSGGGGDLRAMFSRNKQESTTNTSSSTRSYGHGSGSSNIATSVQRPSFALDPSSFKSWGGSLMGLGGGGDMSRVFTASQRQELQRQTLIFKYMTASMPVPPELLIPITSKYPSHLSLPSYQSNDHVKSGLDLRYTIGSRDAEPWRCRRTDGKKWRCSRDVAPDQKYCERHSHKGRPSRSRKLVESSSAPSSSSSSVSIARISTSTSNNTLTPSSSLSSLNPTNMNMKPSFLYQPSPSIFLSQNHQNPSQNTQSRFPEWFMKRETHNNDDEESSGVPSASLFLPQTELDQMTPTRTTSNLFMGNNQNQSPTLPRQFLDAWSIGSKSDELTGKPVDSGSSLLTLSMSGGGTEDSEEGVAQLGMGLFETERERDVGGSGGGAERYSWMGSSAPGGPLAEALCLGIVGTDVGGGSHGRGHGESGGQGLGFNNN